MHTAYSSYPSSGEDGKRFIESYTHYAGLTADCLQYIGALEEAAENDLGADSTIVGHFTSELHEAAMQRSNQALKVERWYGVADAKRELSFTQNVLEDGSSGKSPVRASELVDRVDEISQDFLSRVEELPESYHRKIIDWDEMSHNRAELSERYRELDLSWNYD